MTGTSTSRPDVPTGDENEPAGDEGESTGDGGRSTHPRGPQQLPRTVSALVFLRDQGVFVIWGLLIVVFAFIGRPYFFTVTNAVLVANAAAITAIFAAGVGIGVMTGSLDLSLPGTAAVASCVCGRLLTHGSPTWLSLLAGLACGVVVGLLNGLIVLRGFNPVIVTIGAFSVLSGLAAVIADGDNFPGLSQLKFMGTHHYFATGDFTGIPGPVFIVAAVYIVGYLFLTRTRGGLRVMAVGANAEAVRRAGINSGAYRVLGFVVSGTLAALGGLVSTATVTQAGPSADPSIIFSSLTAVSLTGIVLSGGRGSLPRILVGSLILATISNGLIIRGVQPYWSTVCTGALLIGSLFLERAVQNGVASRLMDANLSAHQK
ncbi:ABC transporter permease [Streptomyces sp. NPDC058464]|uniref:ABC transporter permease n=1 Tax=Streptomyces sp. NPDC058464 TaxID=3346511 RepID=UPI003667750F